MSRMTALRLICAALAAAVLLLGWGIAGPSPWGAGAGVALAGLAATAAWRRSEAGRRQALVNAAIRRAVTDTAPGWLGTAALVLAGELSPGDEVTSMTIGVHGGGELTVLYTVRRDEPQITRAVIDWSGASEDTVRALLGAVSQVMTSLDTPEGSEDPQ